jgi:hypothetical protein
MREHMTFNRRAWLRTLNQGPAVRSSKVGFDCMRLGWTEWHQTPEGEPILDERGRWLERITEKGQNALVANMTNAALDA